MREQIEFRIVGHIGVLSESKSGWTKEINLVSWNGNEAKIDIRDWSPEHDKMSRGITLTQSEFELAVKSWKRYIKK